MCRKCLKCRKNIESKNPEVVRTKNGRIMLLLKFEVWDSKKLKFRKKDTFKWNSFIRSYFVLRVFHKLIEGIKWTK